MCVISYYAQSKTQSYCCGNCSKAWHSTACQQLSPNNPSFEAARSPSLRQGKHCQHVLGTAGRAATLGTGLPCQSAINARVTVSSGYGAAASPHAAGAAAPPPGSAQRCEKAAARPASPGPRLRRHGEGRDCGLAWGRWRRRRGPRQGPVAMATAAEGLPEAGAQPAKRKGPGVRGAPWRRWGRGGALSAPGAVFPSVRRSAIPLRAGTGGLCVRAGQKLSQDKEQAAGLWESRTGRAWCRWVSRRGALIFVCRGWQSVFVPCEAGLGQFLYVKAATRNKNQCNCAQSS